MPIAITTEGEWLLAGEARAALEKGATALPAAFAVEGEPVRPPSVPAHQEIVPRSRSTSTGRTPRASPDVVIPLLHGPYGEDGTVQGLLELAGLPYVGSGVLGSAVGMDKVMMKRAFAAAGLPQARSIECRDGADRDAFAERIVAELGLPAFVKPANMGSSVGVTKAHDRAELDAGIALAFDYDEWCIAGGGDRRPRDRGRGARRRPTRGFGTGRDRARRRVLLLRRQVRARRGATARAGAALGSAHVGGAGLAVRAFEACRCEAMARVDFFLEDGPHGRGFLVNELNTIPGFTPISMYPKLWEASGLSYPRLLDRLIELALARHERRTRPSRPQR